jgi:Peptidase S46
MRKIFIATIFLAASLKSFADEGMWLPMLLGQQVYQNMVKKGLKLKPEQLYSINQASIKDAIVIFGGGCTGEIVSSKGLIFTNHHCGYDAIASASTVEHNYLRDGYWAKSMQEEIPTKLSVQFLNNITDVTKRILDALNGLEGIKRTAKYQEMVAEITKEAVGNNEFKRAVIASQFNGNQYFMYVYDVFKDVRFTGTPPESIGKFGGDTDNWEWPRHTGDFSVFRVYTDKNGQPTKYDVNNIPLKPKYFLPISIKGFKDGDFAMIYGYPGGTTRYMVSPAIELKTAIENPTLVKLRDIRLKYMFDEMKKSAATKLQLASNYASIANYWKFFDGETKQLLKFDTYHQKQQAEQVFINWAKGKSEYENIFTEFEKNYQAWRPFAKHRVYMNEGIFGSPLLGQALSLNNLLAIIEKKDATKEAINKALDAADAARKSFLESENKKSDQNIVAAVLMQFFSDIDKSQHPAGFYDDLFKEYNSLENSPYKAFAADLFTNTLLLDNSKWEAFKANPTAEAITNDPAYKTANAFLKNYNANYGAKSQAFAAKNADLNRLYMKGLMEMNPEKVKMMYPDANFTMRTSFGNVKSYVPKDGVKLDYICTLKGVVDKYQPGDYEFDLPKKLLELYKAKDYGQYADPIANDIVVSFITTNDITGGNSGSPVMNGKGELIGLAFDGNYEALSHKITFDKDLNRTINVDVRYVLWCIEKLGGATNIINELTLIK